jgi:beta-glucosidase
VITDWLRNMPWGVEKLSEKDRQKTMVLAGVDQIGGDNDPKFILASVKDNGIPMTVIDTVARRVLKPMFQMGLFEDPYVDPAYAKATVASQKFLDAGYAAQVKSSVLLKNANNLLPFAAGKKIYVEGISREVAAKYGTVVDNPKEADIAILRAASPLTYFPYGGAFAVGYVSSSGAPPASTLPFGITLAYSNATNWNVLESIKKVAASGTPTVVVVTMDKPVILSEFIDDVAAVFGNFGAGDAATLDLVFGKYAPSGKLPFDLPADMPSVLAQAGDTPFDIDEPLFKFGFGLTYDRK